MDDLWEIASGDHESLAREAALARADAELEGILPFLFTARSDQEFFHRLALARDAIAVVEARNGLPEGEVTETAARRYALYREALAEGTDPLASLEPLLNGGGYGSGPERPDSHTEGPDFSGGYSEVPAGAPGGPDPQVTQVRPEVPGAVGEATGSLRRSADANPESMMMSPYMPPDVGTGNGSVDIGTATPADGGYSPSIPAGMAGGSVAPVGQPTGRPGITTSGTRDPVRSRVLRVTSMIARANPGLPAAECERLGRVVVSRYLHHADLTDSVMGNGPMTGSGSAGGSQGGGGGTGLAGHMLEWQGAKSLGKGLMGGGGEAAGAGELAELAPLAAL